MPALPSDAPLRRSSRPRVTPRRPDELDVVDRDSNRRSPSVEIIPTPSNTHQTTRAVTVERGRQANRPSRRRADADKGEFEFVPTVPYDETQASSLVADFGAQGRFFIAPEGYFSSQPPLQGSSAFSGPQNLFFPVESDTPKGFSPPLSPQLSSTHLDLLRQDNHDLNNSETNAVFQQMLNNLNMIQTPNTLLVSVVFIGIANISQRRTFVEKLHLPMAPFTNTVLRQLLGSDRASGRALGKLALARTHIATSRVPFDIEDNGYTHYSHGFEEVGRMELVLSGNSDSNPVLLPSRDCVQRTNLLNIGELPNDTPVYILYAYIEDDSMGLPIQRLVDYRTPSSTTPAPTANQTGELSHIQSSKRTALDGEFPAQRIQLALLRGDDYGTTYQHAFEVRIIFAICKSLGIKYALTGGAMASLSGFHISSSDITSWADVATSTFKNKRSVYTRATSALKNLTEKTFPSRDEEKLMKALGYLLDKEFVDTSIIPVGELDSALMTALCYRNETFENLLKPYQ
ncbi:hypothetical protein BD410DRAFT_809713 [Rickenella mellea]|uniref:Uncharacterized protein n=1 Tax=Rickenella mellea TaxID=50990 RepID=A0A4Y7PJ65_9AGAM|nr:hypothetical protein BD410DRAFT_809713 [Rickenella mellea]